MWKISNMLDVLLAKEYTPNEAFALSSKINNKVAVILRQLKIKQSAIDRVMAEKLSVPTKTPADVFRLTLKLYSLIKDIQKRLNMEVVNIVIPEEKAITSSTVYNSLRLINASLNEIIIYKNIDIEDIAEILEIPKDKTATDVYINVMKTYRLLKLLFDEKNYES